MREPPPNLDFWLLSPEAGMETYLATGFWAVFMIPLLGTAMAFLMSGRRTFGRRYACASLALFLQNLLHVSLHQLEPPALLNGIAGMLMVLIVLLLTGERLWSSLFTLLAPLLVALTLVVLLMLGLLFQNFQGAASG